MRASLKQMCDADLRLKDKDVKAASGRVSAHMMAYTPFDHALKKEVLPRWRSSTVQ